VAFYIVHFNPNLTIDVVVSYRLQVWNHQRD